MKTILVTGATGGIGEILCHRLSKAGYSLILSARDETRLRHFCDELSNAHAAKHSWIAVDMTSDDSVKSFDAELSDRRSVLDGSVIMPPQLPRSNDPLPSSDLWRTAFQNSFVGPLATLKSAIDHMAPNPAAGQRPKIVIISAISSVQVLGHYALSNAIRAAWAAEAKTLAFALGSRGIHVNTLSLGGVLTPHYRKSIEQRAIDGGMTFDERLAEETSNVPLGKYGKPHEVAAAIEGLLSEFSDHLTGVNITCDGGFTRSY